VLLRLAGDVPDRLAVLGLSGLHRKPGGLEHRLVAGGRGRRYRTFFCGGRRLTPGLFDPGVCLRGMRGLLVRRDGAVAALLKVEPEVRCPTGAAVLFRHPAVFVDRHARIQAVNLR
jgi:hypothetical protein